MPSPVDFRKFGVLLWYMTNAPLDRLKNGTLDPARDFPAYARLGGQEQAAFGTVTNEVRQYADRLQTVQGVFRSVFADANIWTTDCTLTADQILEVMHLASNLALRETTHARSHEHESGQ